MKLFHKLRLFVGLVAPLTSIGLLSHSIINDKGLKDLEFESLVQACDTTTTTHGSQALRYLTDPTSSIDDICARQRLLQRLIEQEDEYGAILEHISGITEFELHAAHYCRFAGSEIEGDKQKAEKVEKLKKLFHKTNFFYKSSVLTTVLPFFVRSMAQYNDSPLFLRCSYWAGMTERLSASVILPVISSMITGWFTDTENAGLAADMQAQGQRPLPPNNQSITLAGQFARSFGLDRAMKKLNIYSSSNTNTAERLNTLVRDAVERKRVLNDASSTFGDCLNARMAGWIRSKLGDQLVDQGDLYEQYRHDNWWSYYLKGKVWCGVPTLLEGAFAGGISAFLLAGVHSTMRRHVSSEHELWEHIKALSAWGNRVQELAEQVRPYSPTWGAAESLIVALDTRHMRNLFDSVKVLEESWNKDYRWMHDPGRVLHIHHCAQKAADQIQRVIRAVGEIDAWMSMASAVKQYGLCPVTLVDSQQAQVRASQLWSLMLDDQVVVKNDVMLGQGSNKMLLTGPNGGGKSTIMKSMAQAVLLAQSWGFASANEFICTPFDCIIVAMDSQQSIKANLSTFMAELKALNQMKRVAQLYAQKGKHCLIILDEPCRGTIEIEAAKRISQFCRELDVCDNIAAILATHMYDPACVAEELNSWQNCQLGHTFLQNTVTRSFELLPGIAHWWFNDADKRDLFLQSLEQDMNLTHVS